MNLYDYPERIETASLVLQESQRRLEKLREQQGLIEQIASLGVLTARDEHGKPAFPNETARTAELSRRLAAHQEYQALKEIVQQAEQEKAVKLTVIEGLRNEFKVALLDRQETIAEKWLSVDAAAVKRPHLSLVK
jgi:hypothetical protein